MSTLHDDFATLATEVRDQLADAALITLSRYRAGGAFDAATATRSEGDGTITGTPIKAVRRGAEIEQDLIGSSGGRTRVETIEYLVTAADVLACWTLGNAVAGDRVHDASDGRTGRIIEIRTEVHGQMKRLIVERAPVAYVPI